jgi:hypothetical protein
LRQWTVDVRRLVAVLSAAVGTDQPPDELIRESAWQLGTVGIAGESYDVVFVRVAAAGGRLYLSTHAGQVLCFAAE